MPAYRESDYRDLCGECSQLSVSVCLRCQRPTCADHDATKQRRCFDCEFAFLGTESRVTRTIVVTLVILGSAVGVLGAMATHAAKNGNITGPSAHWIPLLVPIAVALLALGFVAPFFIRKLMRVRFLRQRKRPASNNTAQSEQTV